MDTKNKNDSPLVSILIPLYNHEQYIVQCLESIITDSYPSKEIIIIDDGSDDNSVEVVNSWYKNNKKQLLNSFIFKRRENRGLCKTLNEMTSMAKGDYIILIASDDYLLPGGIQARLDYLNENKDKLAVFADCIVIDSHNNLICESAIEDLYHGRKKYLSINMLLPYELIFHWCAPGPGFMAKREVYEIVDGYDESLLYEDWDFYLRLGSKNLLGFIDFPVAACRIHETNMIKQFNNDMSQYWPLKIISNNLKRFKGLQRAHLLASKIRRLGTKNKHNGKLIIYCLYTLLGVFLLKVTSFIYEVKIRISFGKKN